MVPDLVIRQGGMMYDAGARHVFARRQQVSQITPPAGRVVTVAKFAAGREVEDAFDPAAAPARRLGFRQPDWVEHLQDGRCVDVGDRRLADDWVNVGR
jgi:hypothetical protein